MIKHTYRQATALALGLLDRVRDLRAMVRRCGASGTLAVGLVLPTLMLGASPPADAAPAPRFAEPSAATEIVLELNDARPTVDLVRMENMELGRARVETLVAASPATAERAALASRGGWRTEPAVAPARPKVAASDFPRLKGQQLEFMLAAVEAAQESQARTGVPASVIIAQALLESDWGRSNLAKVHNYFGIKAHSGPGSAGVVNIYTQEFQGGGWTTVAAPFRAYQTMADGFADHGRFLSENPRYAKAMANKDNPKVFVREVHRAGYATDPAYTEKLIRIMDSHDLYRYNLK